MKKVDSHALPTGHRVLRAPNGWSLRYEVRPVVVSLALAVALAFAVLGSLVIGEFRVSVADAASTLLGDPPDRTTDFFVLERRLPRALVAVVVGASLALSGAIFCTLTRNPLASPDIIGVTQGASAGGAAVLLLLSGSLAQVQAGAVVGAVATTGLIVGLAKWRGLSGARLVLLGVALGAMASAVVAHLLSRVFVASAVTAQTWLIGSLQGRGWDELWLPLAVLVAVGLAVWRQSANLRALAMGDEIAVALGVRVGPVRGVLLVGATLTAAFAVAAAGPISFVALVAPHLARLATRSDRMLPAALIGALLLLVSDLVAQHAFALPVPVGVVTVVLGGLFFLALMWTESRRG